MKLKDILKTVAGGAISALVPGGPAIVAMLNGVLGDDNQLPADATGLQAQSAIETLSTSDKASVLNKQYDVEIEEIRGFTDRFKAMADVDATGNTGRPFAMLMMAWCVVFAVVVTVSLFAYAIYKSDSEMVSAITGGWPFIVGVLSVPSSVILAYFGKRTKEKQQKYEIASGTTKPLDFATSLMRKFTGK